MIRSPTMTEVIPECRRSTRARHGDGSLRQSIDDHMPTLGDNAPPFSHLLNDLRPRPPIERVCLTLPAMENKFSVDLPHGLPVLCTRSPEGLPRKAYVLNRIDDLTIKPRLGQRSCILLTTLAGQHPPSGPLGGVLCPAPHPSQEGLGQPG